MSELDKLISELAATARNTREAVRKAKEETGKEAAGCFLGFGPEELADAAGLLPVSVWGDDREIEKARRYYPAFFCAPVQQMLEQAMGGEYDGLLSAMIMPVYCDALRSAGQNFKTAVPHIPVIPVVYPANRKGRSGREFLASEYRSAGKALEKITGKKITEKALQDSIEVYNRYRSAMREFVKEASGHPDIITPYLRHMLIKAAGCQDKRIYTEKIGRLTRLLKKEPVRDWNGNKVILTGILLESEQILKKMESHNLAVLSDYLLQESLQFQTDAPVEGKDSFYRLACRFADLKFCSVAMDPE